MTRVPRTNLQVAQAWCVVRETVASQWSANVAVIVGGRDVGSRRRPLRHSDRSALYVGVTSANGRNGRRSFTRLNSNVNSVLMFCKQ